MFPEISLLFKSKFPVPDLREFSEKALIAAAVFGG